MNPKKTLLDDPLLKTQNIDHLLKTQNIGKHRIKIYLSGPTRRWFFLKRGLGRLSLALIIFFAALMSTRYFLISLETPDPHLNAILQQCHQYLAHKAMDSASNCYNKVLDQDRHNHSALAGLETIEELQSLPTAEQLTSSPEQQASPKQMPATQIKAQQPEAESNSKPVSLSSAAPISMKQAPHVQSKTADSTPETQPASNTPSADIQPASNTSSAQQQTLDTTVTPEPETQPPPKTATPSAQQQLTTLLSQCEAHFQANRLTSGRSGTAYQCYQQILTQEPTHKAAQRGLKRIEHRYQNWLIQALNREHVTNARHYLNKIRWVNPDTEILTVIDNFYQDKMNTALAEDNLEHARQQLSRLEQFNPHSSVLTALRQTLATQAQTESQEDTIATLLQNCERHFQADRLTSGRSGTALACYRQVLNQQPSNQQAQQGLKRIEARYQAWIESALNRAQYRRARSYLQRLQHVNPQSLALARLQKRLSALESKPEPSAQSKKSLALPATQRASQKNQCGEIFAQESLGIQPLTPAQRQFKQRYCN